MLYSIYSIFSSLPESKFHFYIWGSPYPYFHSIESPVPLLPHNPKLETILSKSFPTHFEVFQGMVQLSQKRPRCQRQHLTHQNRQFHCLWLQRQYNDQVLHSLPFFLQKSYSIFFFSRIINNTYKNENPQRTEGFCLGRIQYIPENVIRHLRLLQMPRNPLVKWLQKDVRHRCRY